MYHLKHIDEDMKKCIEQCNDCRDQCESTLYQHCLKMGGKHVEPKHVKLMTDCFEACQTAAHFMLRGSDNHALFCKVCAEICDMCADSCQEVGGGEMEDCAETCRKCAQSCHTMSQGMQGERVSNQVKQATG